MKKIILLLILMALLSGCIGEERTYIGKTEPDNIIVLKPDGTFEWTDHGYTWPGSYEEKKDTVILDLGGFYPLVVMKKEQNTLKWREGVWVRK